MRARAPPAEPRNPPPVAWVSRRRHAPRERWRTTSRRPTQILNPTARGARGGVASPRESREAPRDGKDTSTIRRATLESILRDGAQERARQCAHPLEGNRRQDAARRNHRVSRDTMAIPVVVRGQKCERGGRIQPSKRSQHQHPPRVLWRQRAVSQDAMRSEPFSHYHEGNSIGGLHVPSIRPTPHRIIRLRSPSKGMTAGVYEDRTQESVSDKCVYEYPVFNICPRSRWCSWLSRQSNTLKVTGSNPV